MHLASCAVLLIFAGPSYPKRLWTLMEVFICELELRPPCSKPSTCGQLIMQLFPAWRQVFIFIQMASPERIEVMLCTQERASAGASKADLMGAFGRVDALAAGCTNGKDRELILTIIEGA